MCNVVPGRLEEWHVPRKAASKRVHYQLQTRTVEQLSARHQTVLATFHATQCYQAFPSVNTAGDKRWVRRPGYEASIRMYCCNIMVSELSHFIDCAGRMKLLQKLHLQPQMLFVQ